MPLDLSKLNVLVVDDNAFVRTLMSDVLYAFGIRNVRECVDGSAALEELKVWIPDIAFVDWMMEPMDGHEFTRRIRSEKESPTPYLPIVMITSDTEQFRVERARDYGVTEFVAKPITPNVIYARLKTVIEKPREFVRVGPYFGPDRRRTVKDFMGDGKRGGDEGEGKGDGESSETPPDGTSG